MELDKELRLGEETHNGCDDWCRCEDFLHIKTKNIEFNSIIILFLQKKKMINPLKFKIV